MRTTAQSLIVSREEAARIRVIELAIDAGADLSDAQLVLIDRLVEAARGLGWLMPQEVVETC